MKPPPKNFAIRHRRDYYEGTLNKAPSEPVMDDHGGALLFVTDADARAHIRWLESKTYELAHGQYGYTLQVVDLRKPRNRLWLQRALGWMD